MQQVVVGGERPRMDWQVTAHWPANLQWLMNRCWSPFPVVRPSFAVVKQVLQDILDGKETVPQLSETSKEIVDCKTPVSAARASLLQPLSRREARSKTVGSEREVEPTKEMFQGLKPLVSPKSGRQRAWSFGLKR